MINYKILFVLLISISLIIVLAIASTSQAPNLKWQTESVYVSKGDTLWKLGREHCPDTYDIRTWVHEVQTLNGRTSPEIYAGETIKIFKVAEA